MTIALQIRLEDITSTSHVEGSCEIRIEYFNFADASDDACVLLQATDGAEARRFIGELRYAICLAHVHYRNGIR